MNLIHILKRLTLCLLLFGGGAGAALYAQVDDYDPKNPAEPNVIEFCKVTVSADPAEAATVSGGGKYKLTSGGKVYLNTSARNTDDYTYTFQYWTLNGARYTSSRGFYYTLQQGEQHFVAHYTKTPVVYDPSNPVEPSGSTIKRRHTLYVTSNLENSCSFNISSGEKHNEGSSIYVRVYPNPYFRFDGWSVDGEIVSTSTSFYYTMPTKATTLEAILTELPYDPESPIDPPSGSQDNIDDTDPQRQLVTLIIGSAGNPEADRTRVVFNEAKSVDYETDCDASKFISTDAALQIYSLDTKGVKYQINERPVEDGRIPLGIIVQNEGTIKIVTTRLDREDAILVDKTLNIEHPLSTGAYVFSTAAGTFENRFELRVTPNRIKGDVNGDKKVTVADAIAIIDYYLHWTIAGDEDAKYDINKDGHVTVADAIDVITIYLSRN